MRLTPKAWPTGLRDSLPLVLPTAAIGMSFGLLAEPLLGAIPSIVMSAVVWSGTAQFAALSILTSGGSIALAAGTGLLANTRFLPMGFAIAPSMTSGPLRRLLAGAVLTDAAFVIGHREGGRFDISAVVWAAPAQYLAWVGGTVARRRGRHVDRRTHPLGARCLVSGFLSQPVAARTVPRAQAAAQPPPDHRRGLGRSHHPGTDAVHPTRRAGAGCGSGGADRASGTASSSRGARHGRRRMKTGC